MNLIISVSAANVFGLVTEIMQKISHDHMINLKYFSNKPNPNGGYILEFEDIDRGEGPVTVEYSNVEDFARNFAEAYNDMTKYSDGFELVTEVIGLLATTVKEAEKSEVTHGDKNKA